MVGKPDEGKNAVIVGRRGGFGPRFLYPDWNNLPLECVHQLSFDGYNLEGQKSNVLRATAASEERHKIGRTRLRLFDFEYTY